VALTIVDYRRPNLTRKPSVEYLAFISGLAPNVFSRSLERLEERQLIAVDEMEDGQLDIDMSGLTSAIEDAARSGTSEDEVPF